MEMGDALYAVIEGRPIAWRVVGFTEGLPQMVPVGKFVRPHRDLQEVAARPVPVTAGEVWTPSRGTTIIYAPDLLSAGEALKAWIEVETDGQ